MENPTVNARLGGFGIHIPTKRGILSVQMTSCNYCDMGETFEIALMDKEGRCVEDEIVGTAGTGDTVRGWVGTDEVNAIIKRLNA